MSNDKNQDNQEWTEMDFDIPEAPTLSFDTGDTEEAPVIEKQPLQEVQPEIHLTPEELAMVDSFVDQIDIHSTQGIMNYGTGTQKKMADFSEKAVGNVRTKDMGETGKMIAELVKELRTVDSEGEQKGFLGRFRKGENRLTLMKARYAKVEENVENISRTLEKHQRTLLKDISILDKMYDLNLAYFKELTMYIIAGRKKLEQVRNTELKELQRKAAETGLLEDSQAASDLAAKCDRFERKLYDLELTRTIALQTGPQLRLVQASDSTMAEKIQSTIVNTIPLWKNQMVIAIGIEHSGQAAKAERQVNDMTNALLKKNADQLKISAAESAREAERGIVDIETLKHTSESLIATLDEVMMIQKEGKEKRLAAQAELAEIESQLRMKLLEASKK